MSVMATPPASDLFAAIRARHTSALIWLVILLTAACLVGLMTGPAAVSLPNVWTGEGGDRHILTYLRGPRVVLGLLVGAALGTSGAVLQALLRKPAG